ncbi:4-coumarate--CoA ligase 1-like isoform X1 [Anoplophora glabripennis]|uniref:4-coumarate--CoA ligase 1-like isoform X1 n=1 Tax=Anoplophora glabripennis TaxID=217634 RepID=UPI000C7823F4|nr:4-coumarate--CoA ligase 1-like isoform X1 [Anoplophora glabripennis]
MQHSQIDVRNNTLKNDNQNEIGYSNYGLGFVLFESMKKYDSRILQYLADTDETDTQGQALIRSIRTALKLKEKGITKDDIVSSCTYNHKNSIIPFIASLFLGIKTAHFDPSLSHLDTIHLLKLIKPKIIFVALESLPLMEKCLNESQVNTELVVFGESEKYSNFDEYLDPSTDEDKFRPVVVDVLETAVIMFSSGTTGLPKGICLSHYGILGQISNKVMKLWGNTRESVLLTYTTLYWLSAVFMVLKSIVEGCARVVCKQFDPAAMCRLIEKYKITSVFLGPYLAYDVLDARQKNIDTSSLKYISIGGAPVTKKLMDELREAFPSATVLQGYAQTEASGMISIFNVNDPKEVELQTIKPLCSGKVVPEYNWKIVDPVTENVLGPNERGEFRYKIVYQMNGYYKMDSSSAYDSEGFIKSGDIAYYDEDNCFFVVDRIKEMFKYKGWHILPAVLEEILLSHPAVKEAVVIGIPHDLDGDHPMGIIALNKGYKDVTPEEIELYVRQRVSDNQRLRAGVKIVGEITKTVTGKIRRNDMKKMVLNGDI